MGPAPMTATVWLFSSNGTAAKAPDKNLYLSSFLFDYHEFAWKTGSRLSLKSIYHKNTTVALPFVSKQSIGSQHPLPQLLFKSN